MGLDLYAGTLTRYYTRNWKSSTQQWAEANGLKFSRMTPEEDAPPQDALDAGEVLQHIIQWRDAILQGVSPKDGSLYEAWNENNEAAYYTDKPDWDAFGALLLYGACKKYALELPCIVPKGWYSKHDEYDAFKRAYADEKMNWSLFTGVEWWIPIADMFSFHCESPNGNELFIGTTGVLLAELNRINEWGWQAGETEILEWQKTEGYPLDATIVDRQYKAIAKNDEYNTESLAKFAFSIFYQAAVFSRNNRVPIIMDY